MKINHLQKPQAKALTELKCPKTIFLSNFSIRSRNALAANGIYDHSTLNKMIENGKIFLIPQLGLRSLREVITWAWTKRNSEKI